MRRKSKAKGEAGAKAGDDDDEGGGDGGTSGSAGKKRAPRKAAGAKRKTKAEAAEAEAAEEDVAGTGARGQCSRCRSWGSAVCLPRCWSCPLRKAQGNILDLDSAAPNNFRRLLKSWTAFAVYIYLRRPETRSAAGNGKPSTVEQDAEPGDDAAGGADDDGDAAERRGVKAEHLPHEEPAVPDTLAQGAFQPGRADCRANVSCNSLSLVLNGALAPHFKASGLCGQVGSSCRHSRRRSGGMLGTVRRRRNSLRTAGRPSMLSRCCSVTPSNPGYEASQQL